MYKIRSKIFSQVDINAPARKDKLRPERITLAPIRAHGIPSRRYKLIKNSV